MELIDNETLQKIKNSIYEFAEQIKHNENQSYNKLINNWNAIDRLFTNYDIPNYNWPMSKNTFIKIFDVHKENLNSKIKKLREVGLLTEGEGHDYIKEGTTGPHSGIYIYETGAKKILEITDSIEGIKYLFKKYDIKKRMRPCYCYISIIKVAVNDIDNAKREHSTIDRRRIDLYLLEKKLAIECDERGHMHENIYNTIARQTIIENHLGCRFIRFNPHPIERNFDIGKVIKAIFYYIFDKKIDGMDPINHYMENYYKESRIAINLDDFD